MNIKFTLRRGRVYINIRRPLEKDKLFSSII